MAAIVLHRERHPVRWLAGGLCALALLLAGCSSTPRAGDVGYTETGAASFYGQEFQARQTSSGERFDQARLTAAHRTLPFGTRLKVTNTQNGKSVIVRVNDRGPHVKGRIIDLTRAAFQAIAHLNTGVVMVRIQVID